MIILGIVLLIFVIISYMLYYNSILGSTEFVIIKNNEDKILSGSGIIPISILPKNYRLNDKKKLEGLGIVVYDQDSATRLLESLKAFMEIKNKRLVYKYIVSGCAGMCKQKLHELLLSNGFLYTPVEKTLKKEIIAYVRAELTNKGFDTKATTTPCNLINILPGKPYRTFLNKDVLVKSFEHAAFVPETWNSKDFLLFDFPPGVYIFKPISSLGSSGFGIEVQNLNSGDKNKTMETVKRIQELEMHSRTKSLNNIPCNVSVSKYINNPLLYPENNRKFHLRCYFAAKIITNNSVKGFVEMNRNPAVNKNNFTWEFTYAPFFVIITAGEEYKQDFYHDKNIHDTHAASTPWFKMLPDGFTSAQNEKMKKEIHLVMKKIKEVFIKNGIATKYKSYRDGYQISGIDIMFDETYNPWLIEINPTAGYGFEFTEYQKFEQDYLSWEYYSLIESSIDKSVKTASVIFKPLQFKPPGFVEKDVFITLPNTITKCLRMLSKIDVFKSERFYIAVPEKVDSVAKIYGWKFIEEKENVKWYIHDVSY